MFADDLLLFSRGDEISVDLMFKAFMLFFSASGLEANLDKSNVYFGGISYHASQRMLEILQMPTGDFPFRYIGVPLSTKKLGYNPYKPLVDRVLARIRSWDARHLTYAGRLQLVKVILFSLQPSGANSLFSQKKVIKEVERKCRICLWTGSANVSKKAIVA